MIRKGRATIALVTVGASLAPGRLGEALRLARQVAPGPSEYPLRLRYQPCGFTRFDLPVLVLDKVPEVQNVPDLADLLLASL